MVIRNPNIVSFFGSLAELSVKDKNDMINASLSNETFYKLFEKHINDIPLRLYKDMSLQYFQSDYGINTKDKDTIKFLLENTDISLMFGIHISNWINFLKSNNELSKQRILDLYRRFYDDYPNLLEFYFREIEFYEYLKNNPEIIKTINFMK